MIESRLLSQDWFMNMRNKTKVLWDIQSLDISWRASHENYDALNQYVNEHQKQLSLSTEIHLLSDDAQDATMRITQLVTNCVVSFTTFLTISEQYMERKFKGDKLSLDKWNQERNNLHENSFEFRLGYDLRNYSQHYGIPVSEVVFIMDAVSIKRLEAYVEVKQLLDGSFNWKQRKQELENIESEKIDIIKLLVGYLNCIDKVYLITLQAHLDLLEECEHFLNDLLVKFSIDEGAHPVVFKGAIPAGKQVPIEKEFIPVYLLNKLKKNWYQKLDFNITKK